MTEEQIKQMAEEYILPLKTLPDADENIAFIAAIREAFVAGAHSLDEEIKQLEAANKILKKALEDNVNTYEKELDKLRSPWISVKERLPPIKTRVLFLDNKGKAWLGKNTISGYAELESDQPEILPPPTVPTCKPIITHWMPIPGLNKGE